MVFAAQLADLLGLSRIGMIGRGSTHLQGHPQGHGVTETVEERQYPQGPIPADQIDCLHHGFRVGGDVAMAEHHP